MEQISFTIHDESFNAAALIAANRIVLRQFVNGLKERVGLDVVNIEFVDVRSPEMRY